MQSGDSIFEFPQRLPETGQTPLTLLAKIRNDDSVAWGHFAQLYGPLIASWCYTCSLQPADAADVAQDVLFTVSQKLGSFHREKPGDTFRGWLWTITRNKVRNFIRQHKNRPAAAGGSAIAQTLANHPGEAIIDDPTPPEYPDSHIYQRAIELIRTEFEANTMQAFWLTAVEEMSPAEAATQLNMTIAAVYKAKSRILKRLRDELEGFLE